MRKKISLRLLAFLLVAIVVAALINPYSRQLVFGPTYQGVPLCAWQEQIRRKTLGEDEKSWLTKLRKWIEPKTDNAAAEKLTRSDRIAIWTSLLDDPAPAMRTRAVQSLWGASWRRSHYGSMELSGDVGITFYESDFMLSGRLRYWNASSQYVISTIMVDEGWSTKALTVSRVSPAPPAWPHLVRMLDDASDEVRQAAFGALQGLGDDAAPAFPRLLELLDHPEPARRIHALQTLNATHPKTRAWLERLIAMLDDAGADVRGNAAHCLAEWRERRMAVAAGPPLVKLLGDPDATVRARAIASLAALHVHLDAIAVSLRDSDPHVRIRAASALDGFGIHRDDAVETLRGCIRHADAKIRRQAIDALSDPAAAKLYPELLHCARSDPDQNVRTHAIAQLWYGGERAVPVLVAFLADPKEEIRESAIGALRNLGPKARLAMPHFLADPRAFGASGIQALGAMGDAAAVPRLIELLEDRELYSQALSTLQALGPVARSAVPRLLDMLDEESPDLHPRLFHALLAIAPERADVFAKLQKHALADLAGGRRDMASSFAQEGARAAALVPVLIQRLEIEMDSSTQAAYVQMLGYIGPPARAAVPILLRLGKDGEDNLRAAILRALGTIDADDPRVVPFLIDQLQQDRQVSETLDVLQQCGARARAALPQVKILLRSYLANERIAALRTLAVIAPRDEALAQLESMLRDREVGVRTAAFETLCSLGAFERVTGSLGLMLREESESTRREVATALGQLGSAALAAAPALAELLADDSLAIANAALAALSNIEP